MRKKLYVTLIPERHDALDVARVEEVAIKVVVKEGRVTITVSLAFRQAVVPSNAASNVRLRQPLRWAISAGILRLCVHDLVDERSCHELDGILSADCPVIGLRYATCLWHSLIKAVHMAITFLLNLSISMIEDSG